MEVGFICLGIQDGENDKIISSLEDKKKINKIFSECRRAAKEDKCFFCGNNVSSFCNSHSLPSFCLKNISVNGEVYFANKMVGSTRMDEQGGVKKAGTFQLICRNCDSKEFQDYENPDNYKDTVQPKMLAQIAIKNCLRMIAKRKNENQLYKKNLQTSLLGKNFNVDQREYIDLDLTDYIKSYEKAKRLRNKNWNGEYYLFFYHKLNYVVPLAFQGLVSLIVDIDGNTVNDIYNKSPDYHIQDLHICVFPLKNETVIMMFVDSMDKRYRPFYKSFIKLPIDEKLSLVNYIIFLYSEDVFLSKAIPQEILVNKKLKEVMQQSQVAVVQEVDTDIIQHEAEKVFSLQQHRSIPNLLDERYKLTL